MKVAIISDIHDNTVNLEKCLHWCKKNFISQLICCGDVTNKDTLEGLVKLFKEPIHLVDGNVVLFDREIIKEYTNINYYGRMGRFKIDNINVGLTHEPYLIDKVLSLGKCDYIFYGHTHKPWEEQRDGVRLINPGTLSGMFSETSFAFWDTKKDKIELILLNRI